MLFAAAARNIHPRIMYNGTMSDYIDAGAGLWYHARHPKRKESVPSMAVCK